MFESTVVKAKVINDETGIPLEVLVLLTSDGPLYVLLDYLIAHWGKRSPAWMSKVIFAIKVFLDYQSVQQEYTNERSVFENFRARLLTGTIKDGKDPSGLWWSARRPADANRIIGNLSDLFNWWGHINPSKANPATGWNGSQHGLRIAEAAYQYRRNKAFLGHTWASESASSTSSTEKENKYRLPKTEQSVPPAFPEHRILDLILKGFKIGRRFNYRDILITLLMNGAGFRESEPFHLYLSDVIEDPCNRGQALVLIHHPSFGDAPLDPRWVDSSGKPRRGNRAAYLAERYGLSPRNWGLSKSAAGWKGGMHESEFGGYYKRAYWFIPEFGQLFWQFWNIYMEQVSQIPHRLRNHPYAFMNVMREPLGEIYKVGKFQNSHAAAVHRIGLETAKHLGTSEHGHRHAYGQRLRKAGVPEEMIRLFMHHSDLESQKVYTAPSAAECVEQIGLALNRLSTPTANLRSDIVRVTASEINFYS